MQDTTSLHYQKLLHDGEALKQLYHCSGIDEFVQLMATGLDWPDLTFEKLINFLNKQNTLLVVPELLEFSCYWQPAEYKKREQSITWVPAFQPLQAPFYQDDMLLQRGNLLAQLIKPVSKIADILPQLAELPVVEPDLLIFHWSRCGSTLLGGLYRQLNGVKLLSESMLISDMLLDPHWPDPLKPDLLQLGIRLQGRFRHGEQQLVVKCNAWDLQHWPLWLQQFPKANVVCLGRQPAQILASHLRMSGMHMAGVSGIWQYSDPWLNKPNLLEGRIAVLSRLMHYTSQLLLSGRCNFLDYQQLLQQSPQQLAAYIMYKPNTDELRRWQVFLTKDAKQPERVFQATETATAVFTELEQQKITAKLDPFYHLFLDPQAT